MNIVGRRRSWLKNHFVARGIFLFSVTLVTTLFVLQGYSPQVIFVYQNYFQDDPYVLRSAIISTDDYIRIAGINISDRERFKSSFKEYGKLIPAKTYKITLTEEEQSFLYRSSKKTSMQMGVRNIKWASSADINLLKQGPFPLLPDFKTPCWLNAQYQLRCLPFFYLIGCSKCGTTDLFRMLKAHPDFRAFMKEPHWLTRRRFNTIVPYGFDKYTENMARPLSDLLKLVPKIGERNISDYILQRRGTGMIEVTQNVVLGDCSASTIWDNLHWKYLEGNHLPLEPTLTNADYIYHLNNKTKIVAILRNPITRLYSDYNYFHGGEEKTAGDFHHDVILSVREMSECFKKYSIRSCVHSTETVISLRVRLWIGIYFIHLQEWLRVFPREQIFIIRLEDYSEHKEETVRKLYHFLTLKNATKSSFERRLQSPVAANSNKHLAYQNSSILEETRYILYTFYKPFNQELARLLNDTRFDYGPY